MLSGNGSAPPCITTAAIYCLCTKQRVTLLEEITFIIVLIQWELHVPSISEDQSCIFSVSVNLLGLVKVYMYNKYVNLVEKILIFDLVQLVFCCLSLYVGLVFEFHLSAHPLFFPLHCPLFTHSLHRNIKGVLQFQVPRLAKVLMQVNNCACLIPYNAD